MFKTKRLLKTIPQRDIITTVYNMHIKMQYFIAIIRIYLTNWIELLELIVMQ